MESGLSDTSYARILHKHRTSLQREQTYSTQKVSPCQVFCGTMVLSSPVNHRQYWWVGVFFLCFLLFLRQHGRHLLRSVWFGSASRNRTGLDIRFRLSSGKPQCVPSDLSRLKALPLWCLDSHWIECIGNLLECFACFSQWFHQWLDLLRKWVGRRLFRFVRFFDVPGTSSSQLHSSCFGNR